MEESMQETPRSTRSDGARTRRRILDAASQLATVEGLDGLSIAGLAKEVGMSKSGLYAHFGSKEELQLATIEAAGEIFLEAVIRPGLAAPKGVQRVRTLCFSFLSYVEGRVFEGGCFFTAATAELSSRPGPVRDTVARQTAMWRSLLSRVVREAQELGELPRETDPDLLAFQLAAILVEANGRFVLSGDIADIDLAGRCLDERLVVAGTRR